jgi:hypothetical protein
MKVRKCTRSYRNQTFMLMPLAKMRNLGVSLPQRLDRVEAVSALLYDELAIQESRGATPDPEAAAALLARRRSKPTSSVR